MSIKDVNGTWKSWSEVRVKLIEMNGLNFKQEPIQTWFGNQIEQRLDVKKINGDTWQPHLKGDSEIMIKRYRKEENSIKKTRVWVTIL